MCMVTGICFVAVSPSRHGRTLSHSHGQKMFDSTFFVGWGTLSLINAGLAQGKGRSGLAWCLISLFVGPIATFLIVILSRVEND